MKAVEEVMFSIPREVLLEAYKDDFPNWREAPVSLEEQILNKTIRKRVIPDADLVGGYMVVVSVQGLKALYSDTYTIVYRIPEDRLAHKQLISVLSVGYLPFVNTYSATSAFIGTMNPTSLNDVSSAGQRIGDAMSNIPMISNASCDIVGANTVMIRDTRRVTDNYHLRCMVANDKDMNNINPRSVLYFSGLCVWAVKAYIYNTLRIRIGSGKLSGGQELGAFKDTVDEYSDAEEGYRTYLREMWQAVAFMNDQNSHERWLRVQVSPAL